MRTWSPRSRPNDLVAEGAMTISMLAERVSVA
jgi:hypothetical protein